MDLSAEIKSITASSFETKVDSLSEDKGAAAKKFESLLATMLVKELRKGLGEGLFGEGTGSDIYSGWFDQHVGEALSRDGAFDLEGMIRVGIDTKIAAVEEGEKTQ